MKEIKKPWQYRIFYVPHDKYVEMRDWERGMRDITSNDWMHRMYVEEVYAEYNRATKAKSFKSLAEMICWQSWHKQNNITKYHYDLCEWKLDKWDDTYNYMKIPARVLKAAVN